LTLYNEHQCFAPNGINRSSLGARNKDLEEAADASLTIYVRADASTDPIQQANWLPSPKAGDFPLDVRAYWPTAPMIGGSWTPPVVMRVVN
jgi:hypothetical protein